MKRTITTLLLLATVTTFANEVYVRAPQNIRFATYAIDSYTNGVHEPLSRSITEKNRFVSSLTYAIQNKYPSTAISHIINRENEKATAENFLKKDKVNQAEMVLFVGHGNQQVLAFDDKDVNLQPSTVKFGENTKWVVLEACQALNVNKLEHIGESISDPNNINSAKLNNLKGLFNGVHAILGHYAKTFQWMARKSWFSTAYWRTEDKFDYFAQNFITEGMGIWDAYSSAMRKMYNNFEAHRSTGTTNKIKGLRPAIAYFKKTFPNGSVLDMSQETFASTYDAPIYPTAGSTSTILIKTLTLGNPQYYID